MDADKCLTLPEDLLVDIFRRLGTTAVIRCAGVCRPWRRAIIANASCLRPRPDRFLPDLLLGFLEKSTYARFPWNSQLQYVPASSHTEVPSLFTPATGVGVRIDGRLYNNLLSSRDGFLLLGESTVHKRRLCLCTALTGACKVLPADALLSDRNSRWMYVLATGYDVEVEDHSGDEAAVWILAVKWVRDSKDSMMYQIFSSTSGAWGPVRCSAKFPEDVSHLCIKPNSMRGGTVVVCHGVVSCIVYLLSHRDVVNRSSRRMCMLSVDLRTERSWTTELPDFGTLGNWPRLVLAVSEDGQLSLARMLLCLHRIEVWVLVGDGQWMLRRTIDDVQPAGCPSMDHMWLTGFCPRSGYLLATGRDGQNKKVRHHFVIGVDGRSTRLIGSVVSSCGIRFPYEMDCSTYISSYISKMKYF